MISPYNFNVPEFIIAEKVMSGELKIGNHLYSELLGFVFDVVLTKDLNNGYFEVTPVDKGYQPFRIPGSDHRWQPTLQRALYYSKNVYERQAREAIVHLKKVEKLIELYDCSYYPSFVEKPKKKKK